MAVRRLYLLRHAKSSWDDPALSDRERPLNKRGRKAAKRMAQHLGELDVAPAAVLVSPAARAAQTWDRIAAGLPEGTASWTDDRIYSADSDQLLELLRELPSAFRSAMLIGHNPSIQGLATRLATDGAELSTLHRKFPTAALATLSFAVPWIDLRPGVAELEGFVRPKQLD
ncbi:MAG TPA: histidine phosphatase family protein [Solirubrobacterales bacterium]|nr:histidine phosphatase family protein [Solirubrobacterales bacterium]